MFLHISIKPEDWDEVGNWMWDNREFYNGLSVLPFDGGNYTQTPFESISENEFNKRIQTLIDIDLTKVIELDDNTTLTESNACSGGKCDII